MSRIKLTETQRQDVLNTGGMLCPECETAMELFPANQKGHAAKFPEFYCRKCHVSAPLFEG